MRVSAVACRRHAICKARLRNRLNDVWRIRCRNTVGRISKRMRVRAVRRCRAAPAMRVARQIDFRDGARGKHARKRRAASR